MIPIEMPERPLLEPEPIGDGEWIKEVFKIEVTDVEKHKACSDKWFYARNKWVAMFWRWRMDCHTKRYRAVIIVDDKGNELYVFDVNGKKSYY